MLIVTGYGKSEVHTPEIRRRRCGEGFVRGEAQSWLSDYKGGAKQGFLHALLPFLDCWMRRCGRKSSLRAQSQETLRHVIATLMILLHLRSGAPYKSDGPSGWSHKVSEYACLGISTWI